MERCQFFYSPMRDCNSAQSILPRTLTYSTASTTCSSAYGWPANLDDAAILERLLALNLERAAAERQDV